MVLHMIWYILNNSQKTGIWPGPWLSGPGHMAGKPASQCAVGSPPGPDGLYCMSSTHLSPHFLSAYYHYLLKKYIIKTNILK